MPGQLPAEEWFERRSPGTETLRRVKDDDREQRREGSHHVCAKPCARRAGLARRTAPFENSVAIGFALRPRHRTFGIRRGPNSCPSKHFLRWRETFCAPAVLYGYGKRTREWERHGKLRSAGMAPGGRRPRRAPGAGGAASHRTLPLCSGLAARCSGRRGRSAGGLREGLRRPRKISGGTHRDPLVAPLAVPHHPQRGAQRLAPTSPRGTYGRDAGEDRRALLDGAGLRFRSRLQRGLDGRPRSVRAVIRTPAGGRGATLPRGFALRRDSRDDRLAGEHLQDLGAPGYWTARRPVVRRIGWKRRPLDE